jgi:hypothetical protein
MQEEILLVICDEVRVAEILVPAGKTFSSCKELPYTLLNSRRKVDKVVWRDPKTLQSISEACWQQ